MNELSELLDHYFSLGVAEGKEGRDHDTADGEAQATRDLIDMKIERLREEQASAMRQFISREVDETRRKVQEDLDKAAAEASRNMREEMEKILAAQATENVLRPGEKKLEPIGYCSEYGLTTLARKAHHYCLSVSKAAENEFQLPIYAAPPSPKPAAVSEGGEDE